MTLDGILRCNYYPSLNTTTNSEFNKQKGNHMSKLDRLIEAVNRLQASIEQLVPKEISMPTMTASETMAELGISVGTLHNWSKIYGHNLKLDRNCYSATFVRELKRKKARND